MEHLTLKLIAAVVASAFLFAVSFWGAIWVVSGRDARNSFPMALFLGFILVTFGTYADFLLMGLPALAIFLLLVNYYRIGIFRSFFVLTVSALLYVAIAAVVARFLEHLGY